jgi:hypothetical protein
VTSSAGSGKCRSAQVRAIVRASLVRRQPISSRQLVSHRTAAAATPMRCRG